MQQPDSRQIIERRRQALADAWLTLAHDGVLPGGNENVSAEVAGSWRRSLQYLSPWVSAIPLETPQVFRGVWEASPLNHAIKPMQAELEALVEEGFLAAVLTDNLGRVLWVAASQYMQERVTEVNFVPGSCWDERSAGTNAIALALLHHRPVVVFAAEHYLRCMHEWVCYAAPVLHPQSAEMVGIFCVATTWDKHTPLGERAVAELAHSLRRNLSGGQRQAELQVHAMGSSRVLFRGKEIHLSLRQMEILCLLILNPQGMQLVELHSALYGDSPVTTASLKAELSHLRHILGGEIGSRPYRLLVSTWADFIILWKVLQDRQADKALNLYRGPFLPQSASPELEEWRNCIEAVMEQAVAACRDPGVLLSCLTHGSPGSERVRDRLLELAKDETV